MTIYFPLTNFCFISCIGRIRKFAGMLYRQYTHRISPSLAYWATANLFIKALSFLSFYIYMFLHGTINQQLIQYRQLRLPFFLTQHIYAFVQKMSMCSRMQKRRNELCQILEKLRSFQHIVVKSLKGTHNILQMKYLLPLCLFSLPYRDGKRLITHRKLTNISHSPWTADT